MFINCEIIERFSNKSKKHNILSLAEANQRDDLQGTVKQKSERLDKTGDGTAGHRVP